MVDVAAGDAEAGGVVVLVDGVDELCAFGVFFVAEDEGVFAFAIGPSVVAAFGNPVDFFVEVLADIGAPEAAGCIEGEAPWVANAGGVDLRKRIFSIGVGIVFGDAVAAAVPVGFVDVDAKDFAVERAFVLGEAEFVVAFRHVAYADVKVAVGAEDEVAAVVVPVDEGDFDEDALGAGVGFIGVGSGDLHLGDEEAFGLLLGVAEVKFAGGFVVGMEDETVEAFFEFAVRSLHVAVAEVEEEGGSGGIFVFW